MAWTELLPSKKPHKCQHWHRGKPGKCLNDATVVLPESSLYFCDACYAHMVLVKKKSCE